MANELQVFVGVTLTKSNLKRLINAETVQVTVSGNIVDGPKTVTVGTSEEDLTVGDVATLGWVYGRNIDATNFVKYGPKSAGSMIVFGRCKPGEIFCFRFEPGITLRWIADTGAVNMDIMVVSD
jgi:hypothetical protein